MLLLLLSSSAGPANQAPSDEGVRVECVCSPVLALGFGGPVSTMPLRLPESLRVAVPVLPVKAHELPGGGSEGCMVTVDWAGHLHQFPGSSGHSPEAGPPEPRTSNPDISGLRPQRPNPGSGTTVTLRGQRREAEL